MGSGVASTIRSRTPNLALAISIIPSMHDPHLQQMYCVRSCKRFWKRGSHACTISMQHRKIENR
jgi:hypothetical protein